MKRLLVLFLALAWTLPAWSGELTLTPREVANGEPVLLRWNGATLSSGVTRFRDTVVSLYPDPQGAVALIPVGLDVPPGDYLLPVALVDDRGKTETLDLVLTVVGKERPQESLTLPERMVEPNAADTARIRREAALLSEVFAKRTPRLWTTFRRPVAEQVSSVFGKRRLLNGKPKSPHSGTDFRSPAGTPVATLSNGRVVLAADLFYTGLTVVVDHGEGLFSLSAHLSKIFVTEGESLVPGDVVGLVGSTGRSTGAHLHLTVRLLGEKIDPMALLDLPVH